jgi:hypothetical protein
MTKPMIRIHNVETNEIIDREMTAAEIKKYEAEQEIQKNAQLEFEKKEAQKLAIAERLGLTVDELQVLLG